MGRYIATYRPLNILFIAIAQFLAAYFLDTDSNLKFLYQYGLQWLIVGTAACTAFGYWLNDLLDIQRDIINNKTTTFAQNCDKKLVYIHLLAFVSIALYAGNQMNIWFLGLFIGTLLALSLYNIWFKNLPLIGNLTVTVLCVLSLMAVKVLLPDTDIMLLLHFALLAGFITLCREVVKDMEDIEGDKMSGAKTFPILVGLNGSNMFTYFIVILTLAFCVVSIYSQSEYLSNSLKWLYYTYYLLFVIVPLYKIAIDVRYAKEKSEYSRLSKLLKYVLFTGILSILFF